MDWCEAEPDEDDIFKWNITIVGPKDTPYAGGVYYVGLTMTKQYPRVPPDVKFQTRIYHPSVRKEGTDVGKLCKDIIKSTWTNNSSVVDVVTLLYSMLQNPPTDNPVESAIAKELASDPEEFKKKARQWAKHFADAGDSDDEDEEEEEEKEGSS